MRPPVDATKVQATIEGLGRAARAPGRVYLTGGATAVLLGWRESTADVDLKFDPEPPGVFEAIPRLKRELDVNLELASPDDFIPPLPGWRERSRFIVASGSLEFFHYDFRAQALAKIERGHRQDLLDARTMLEQGLVDEAELRRSFEAIRPGLVRYPAIEPDAFAARLEAFLAGRHRP